MDPAIDKLIREIEVFWRGAHKMAQATTDESYFEPCADSWVGDIRLLENAIHAPEHCEEEFGDCQMLTAWRAAARAFDNAIGAASKRCEDFISENENEIANAVFALAREVALHLHSPDRDLIDEFLWELHCCRCFQMFIIEALHRK